jgi:CheY-like chemotaxis protein
MKVLYVDDEADIRTIASMALELDPDFEVRTEASGTEALATAADWRPDAILLDVMMPTMDGPTTLAKLRQNTDTSGIPVIFVTARAQAHELKHFISLGALDVITKPFDPMSLAAAVKRRIKP